MRRGDVILVHLPAPQGQPGREQFGTRPAVVIQSDLPEYAILATVVIVPLTSQLKALSFSGSFRVEPTTENGLDVPSVVLTQQLRAVDKKRVQATIGRLSEADCSRLEAALKTLLGLSSHDSSI